MRELEFRAWDWKRMLDWKELFSFKSVCWLFDNSNLKLIQFTWGLDKNGKKIHEGDICFKEWYWKKCIIRWNKEWLKYEAFYWIATESIFWNTLEVIGNIYENPDLLEKENK